MKKLVFMFVAVAAISFASCGGNKPAPEAVDTDSIAVVDSVEEVVDSLVDSTAVAADSAVAQ